MKTQTVFRSAAIAFMTMFAAASQAQDAGSWLIKLGVHEVDPKSDNGRLAGGALAADVDGSARPSLQIEYFVARDVGIEVIAAWPFSHRIELNGAEAGSAKHLPPTVSLQYHVNSAGRVSPFIGAGINYTRFFSERESGPLAGTELSLGASWGLAAHAGVDIKLGGNWLAGADVRWLDIDTHVRVDGADVGTVNIDPLAYGVYVGRQF